MNSDEREPRGFGPAFWAILFGLLSLLLQWLMSRTRRMERLSTFELRKLNHFIFQAEEISYKAVGLGCLPHGKPDAEEEPYPVQGVPLDWVPGSWISEKIIRGICEIAAQYLTKKVTALPGDVPSWENCLYTAYQESQSKESPMAQPMTATQTKSSIMSAGVTAEQVAQAEAAGVDLGKLWEWVNKYGPQVMEVVMFFVNLFTKKPTPTPPAPAPQV